MTAGRFIPDPFSVEAGGRLFKTGDVVRYREDGNIEFLGRVDQQVKLRGYRIELGEIEAALLGHGGVGQTVVVMQESEAGGKKLVAYVVAKDPAAGVDSRELRDYLGRRLPEYMVPGVMVQLGELPLTPNGKVDRKALPEPASSGREGEYVGARDAEEEILSGIMAGVLKRERAGVQDNFFEMGGHSLLATQVMSRVRSVFGVEVPLRALFEAPTVAGLAEWVRRARRGGQVEAPRMAPVGREGDVVGVSYAQQRMWFLNQLSPESGAYNMPFGLRLSGELDEEALKRSLREIVRRHEGLRSSFAEKGGEVVAKIGAPGGRMGEGPGWKVEDLRGLGVEEREVELERLAREEAGRPFDLSRGSLLRVKLVQLEEQEHVLLVTMHHIVGDGWSSGIMVREFGRLYEAYVKGEESPLAELAIQYADYAVWQREWLQGEVLEGQLGYWRKQLRQLAPLDLPTDHARPAVMSQRGGAVACEVPVELTKKLKELGQRQGVTLFMCLLSAFQVVLSKYAGQEDVAVGTPVANRNRVEVEELIGLFVNTLVVRTELGGDPSLEEVLKRVRQVTLDAYQHQDVPFEKLVEELQPERDLGRTPLFQVMLALQNTEREELQLPGLKVRELRRETEVAKFDLLLALGERGEGEGEGLSGELSYARELYEEGTAKRLLEHWRVVLEGMVEWPERRIGEVSLLTEEEREQVLVEWNRTEVEIPQQCVHELFEEQAEQTPEAVAVVYEGQRFTYGELNGRANQLGHYLRTLGVGPEVRVGICVERGVEMVIGLLGILKAGGAFVPLDPGYPRKRLEYMVEDSQAEVLLTEKGLQKNLPEHTGRTICLDADWARIAAQDCGGLDCPVGSATLARVGFARRVGAQALLVDGTVDGDRVTVAGGLLTEEDLARVRPSAADQCAAPSAGRATRPTPATRTRPGEPCHVPIHPDRACGRRRHGRGYGGAGGLVR